MQSLRQCGSCSREMPADSRVCPYCATPVEKGSFDGRPVNGHQIDSGPIDHDPANTGETLSRPAWLERESDLGASGIHGRFLPGTRLLERYRVVALLGRGGMGEVYRADDLELGQSVALKFLPEEVLGNRDRLARFRKEVRIARQISHPNVCRVYDIGKAGHQYFLSMEFVDGEDLASELRRLGRPSREKALEMARQLCAGLDAAHKEGILHRDLKPANIMIDGRGRVRITDFGLAGFSEELDAQHGRSGTPAYMAPEQLVGGRVTTRSDLYSLGLVLFELFSGVRYRDEVSRHSESTDSTRDSTDVSLSSLVPDLDPGVEKIVSWCLAEDPAQRPRSAMSVAAALPGGDPLAAALEAGETPSPEMVAEAGGTGALHLGAAWGFLIATLTLMVMGVALSDAVGVARLVMPEKPPVVMAETASALAREIGYPLTGDSGFGLCSTETDQAVAGVSFWYRESPKPLISEYRLGRVNLTGAGVCAGKSGVTPTNPGSDLPGMMLTRLDRKGRLLEFELVPAGPIPTQHASREPDYSPLFRAAGIEFENMRSVAPSHRPRYFADRLDAWESVTAGTEAVRVEASSLAGRPAGFRLFRASGTAAASTEPARFTELSSRLVAVTYQIAFLGSVLLGIHNLRRGRADKRGAIRLAILVLALKVVEWALRAGNLPLTVFGRLDIVTLALGDGLQAALRYWFFYLAIEPYARRLWPRCLIGWSRALMGRWRDPLVGRELLVGVLFGSSWFVLLRLTALVANGLGTPPNLEAAGLWLNQVLEPLAGLVHQSRAAIFIALWAATTVMILLVMLRNKRLAVLISVALFTAMLGLAENHWIYWVTWAVICASSIYLIARVGLLALVIAFFLRFALPAFPVTWDFSVWYLNAAMLPLVACAAVAIYGFYVALAGRPLIRDLPARSPA